MTFRTLKADEIDVRIAQINKAFVTLLLYKDARVDMNILDESVGCMNWQKQYTRENANCIVSIWDDDKKQWISKEDTGTESYTEKEKGLASDSFKRACFNWGIGRELYTAPRIIVPVEKFNVKDGKCYDTFTVIDIGYDEDRNINKLEIKNDKTKMVIFCMANPDAKPIDEKISPDTAAKVLNKCAEDKIDVTKLCKKFKIKTLNNLTKDDLRYMLQNWSSEIKMECSI